MTGVRRLSRRGRTMVAIIFLIALAAALPLRLAFAVLDARALGVAARSMQGPIWWGHVEDLQIAGARVGSVDARLSPLQLLLGRARFDVERNAGQADDIRGGLTIGLAARGLDDVTGTVPLDGAFPSLPVSAVEMQAVSVAFSGSRCVHAEGRMRALIGATVPGLDLAAGLSGPLRCEGQWLLVPLVSQSGMEHLDLRIGADGTYEGAMTVMANDPVLIAALAGAGFRDIGGRQTLRVEGSL